MNTSQQWPWKRLLLSLFAAVNVCAGTISAAADRPLPPVKRLVTPIKPTTPLSSVAAANAPQVFYTDIVSGPNNGGENGKGIYLSIFGKNFGTGGLGSTVRVYINNVEVDNYRYLGPSKGREDIQQITVQVGALGNPQPGVALPITVVVDGVASNSDQTFTVNPGRILFVDNVAGNDATAVIGNIAQPYRYVQTADVYTGGAWPQVAPGDFIVMRGHGNASPWTDVGFEHYFMRFRNKSGSAPTGAPGTGAIVLMGYPGEDTYIRGTIANGMSSGCISGINGQSFTGMGQWAVVSNLRIDCEGYDGPISQQIYGHHWRVVNNDLAASTAPRTGASVPRMAGITGNGDNAVWYGNHIHDIQGSSGECHGIYIDGDGSYDIAYNQIHDIRDGNGFQVYVNGGNGSDVANNISLHHNLIHDVSKHGINIADGAKNNVAIWNNIVYSTAYAALRFNTVDLNGARIFNNTFYQTNLSGNSSYGALTNDWNLPAGAMDVENNIFYVAPGTPYNSGSNGVTANAGTFTHNLWFNGTGSTDPDTAPIAGDPQFVNTAGADFHLQASSPAIGAGSAAVLTQVTNDFDLTQPRSAPIDVGALMFAGGVPPTAPPVLLSAPTLQGTPQVGNLLVVTSGTWSNIPTSYQYQVLRNGVAVTGATGDTYLLTALDAGASISWRVTATNAKGSTEATSNAVTVASTTGLSLSITTSTGGSITSAPAGINCGSTCSASFSPGANVLLTANPVVGYKFASWGGACSGSAPTCTVAMNSAQSVSASFLPAGAVPINKTLPIISGTPLVGKSITCSQGTWSNSPLGYTYQWNRGAAAIAGTNQNSYTVVSADIQQSLSCSVTASNSNGSATAASIAVTGVASIPPVTIMQSKSMSLGSGASTVTLDQNVAATSWIAIALVTWNNAPYNASLSDNHGHAAAAFGSSVPVYVDPFGTMWAFVKANTAGPYALSVNTNNASFGTAYVFEISGADATTFQDAKGLAISGTGTKVAGKFAATSHTHDLLLSVLAVRSGSTTILPTGAGAWNTVATQSEQTYLTSSVIQLPTTTNGTYSFGATLGSSMDWRLSAIVIRGQY